MNKNIIKKAGLVLSVLLLITGAMVLTGCEDTLTSAIENEVEIASAAGGSPHDGTILINTGDAYTNSTAVSLSIFAKDDIGTTDMRISENSDYSDNSWIIYGTSYAYNLSPGDGVKTVYIWFKDGADQVSSRYSASIILDTSSPSYINRTPSPNTTGIARATTIQVRFDQPVDPSTLINTNFYLKNGVSPVTAVLSYSSGTNTATLTPNSDLDWNTLYTAYLTTGVKDAAGNSLVNGSTWSFTIKPKVATLEHLGGISLSSLISSASLSNAPTSFSYMTVKDNYIFVTTNNESVYYIGYIFKINALNPSHLTYVNSNDLSHNSQMVITNANYIFVGHSDGNIYQMNYSLNETGVYGSSTGGFINFSANGNIAQISNNSLISYSPTTLNSGTEISNHSEFSYTEAITTYGNWTYVASTDYSDYSPVNSIDVVYTGELGVNQGSTSISQTIVITSSTGDSTITGVDSHGGELLYVTHSGSSNGIVVLDTNDPSDPYGGVSVHSDATSALSSLDGTEDISIDNNYAIVARAGNGFAVLDLTSFYSPAILLSANAAYTAGAYRVIFKYPYFYVLEGSGRTSLTTLNVYELSID